MAIKKDIKAWAIKLRGRSFRSLNSLPFLYMKKLDASAVAIRVAKEHGITAEPVRVKIKVEEI